MLGSKPCYVREIRHPSRTPAAAVVVVPSVSPVEILKPVKCNSYKDVKPTAPPPSQQQRTAGIQSQENTQTPQQGDEEDEGLPDGSCFRRAPLPDPAVEDHYPCRPISCEGVKVGTLRPVYTKHSVPSIAARSAEYLGSFAVAGAEQSVRAEYVRTQLSQLRSCTRSKPVLLVVSLAGVKVCSPDGKVVHMAHALRRISYATCDPESALFSFLAREPKGHFSLQYCHSFRARSPQQAEQLNSIVGNAFRMAYAAQLTRQPSPFGELIATPPVPGSSSPSKTTSASTPSSTLDSTQQHEEMNLLALTNNNNNNNNHNNGLSNNQNNSNSSTPTKQLQQRHTWAKTMAGRAAAAAAASESSIKLQSPAKPGSLPGLRSCSPRLLVPASPESDESNSPTELNCARRVGDKPPLVKRLGVVGLVSPSPTPPSRVGDETTGDEPLKPLDPAATLLDVQAKRSSQTSPASNSAVGDEFRSKRSSQTSSASSGGSSSGPLAGLAGSSRGPSPPPLPERSDSLGARAEEEERAALHAAPWFQAGIPREIALEVLSQEPVGAFMVRESTTKPGCYALSLRVPRDFQPAGIAHYLIMRTARGYKIKGFTKEFSTLVALITHHSVMPELLPCPLALSRQHNPNFASSDANFADMDSDPDYSALADFRKMMADLDV